MNRFRAIVGRRAAVSVAIFLLALAPRLLLALRLDPHRSIYTDPLYEKFARNVSLGRGFMASYAHPGFKKPMVIRSFRPPLFPMLWGMIYGPTRGSYRVVRVFHALLSSASVVVAYWIGLRLVTEAGAAVGALAAAGYPPLVWHSVHLMTEPLFIFFLLSAVLLLLRAVRREGGAWDAMGAGVCCGLGTLARSVLQGFVPLAGVWLFFLPRRRRRGALLCVSFWGAFALTLCPWAMRNWRVHHAFVLTTTDAGHGFFIGNNARTLQDPAGVFLPQDLSFLEGLSEVEIDRRLYGLGLRYLCEHPAQVPRLMWDKFCRFWRFYPHVQFVASGEFKSNLIGDNVYVVIYGLSFGILFPLCVIGFFLAVRHHRGTRAGHALVLVLVGYMTGIHMIFIAVLRYRVPLMPILLMYSGYALALAFRLDGWPRRGR